MSRETKKITLPISKQECEIITYFTRREQNEIQQITREGMEIDGFEDKETEVNGKKVKMPKLKGFNMDAMQKAKDRTLEIAVKTISGKEITLDDILDLPDEDAKHIEKSIDEITPDEEVKKNTEKD